MNNRQIDCQYVLNMHAMNVQYVAAVVKKSSITESPAGEICMWSFINFKSFFLSFGFHVFAVRFLLMVSNGMSLDF